MQCMGSQVLFSHWLLYTNMLTLLQKDLLQHHTSRDCHVWHLGRRCIKHGCTLLSSRLLVSWCRWKPPRRFGCLSRFVSLGIFTSSPPLHKPPFLEFIPALHQYLLTVLFICWALGQLIASLVHPSLSFHRSKLNFYLKDHMATHRQPFLPHSIVENALEIGRASCRERVCLAV